MKPPNLTPDCNSNAGVPMTLTPEQLQAVKNATQRSKKIRRAVTIAKIDGGATAFFALTAILSFCFGIEGPILGLAMGAVAVNSFRGASKLQRFDRSAPRLLMYNQFFLAAAIILYAAWCLHQGLTHPMQLISAEAAELEPSLADLNRKVPALYWLVYGLLAIGTLIAQGLTGLYYGTRANILNAYLDATPQWIVDLQIAQGA